jgi:magnesium transporter
MAQIDKEVDQIERALFSGPDVSEDVAKSVPAKPKLSIDSASSPIDEKGVEISTSVCDEESLYLAKPQQRVKTAKFQASPLPVSVYIRRARRFIKSLFSKSSAVPGVGEPWTTQRVNPATRTVYKMAKMRRLVTSLARLLSTKADLIGQIRKRLVTRGEWSLDSDRELYIHMGDILGQ